MEQTTPQGSESVFAAAIPGLLNDSGLRGSNESGPEPKNGIQHGHVPYDPRSSAGMTASNGRFHSDPHTLQRLVPGQNHMERRDLLPPVVRTFTQSKGPIVPVAKTANYYSQSKPKSSSKKSSKSKDRYEEVDDDDDVIRVPKNCDDEELCNICGDWKSPETLLLCDDCDCGFHMACLVPPLTAVPDGDWFCPECLGKRLPKPSKKPKIAKPKPVEAPPAQPVLVGPDGQLIEYDDGQPCEACRSWKDWKTMLLCDLCDRAYHMKCLRPPLTQVPPGDWYCPVCDLNSVDDGENGKRKKGTLLNQGGKSKTTDDDEEYETEGSDSSAESFDDNQDSSDSAKRHRKSQRKKGDKSKKSKSKSDTMPQSQLTLGIGPPPTSYMTSMPIHWEGETSNQHNVYSMQNGPFHGGTPLTSRGPEHQEVIWMNQRNHQGLVTNPSRLGLSLSMSSAPSYSYESHGMNSQEGLARLHSHPMDDYSNGVMSADQAQTMYHPSLFQGNVPYVHQHPVSVAQVKHHYSAWPPTSDYPLDHYGYSYGHQPPLLAPASQSFYSNAHPGVDDDYPVKVSTSSSPANGHGYDHEVREF